MRRVTQLVLFSFISVLFVTIARSQEPAITPAEQQAIIVKHQQLQDEIAELKSQVHHIQVDDVDHRMGRGEESSNVLLRTSDQVKKNIYQEAINFIHGVTIATSPVLGLKSAWNSSDLLYAVPSMNEDLTLLRHRSSFQKLVEELGGSLNTRSILIVSGGIEGAVNHIRSFSGAQSVNLTLNTAELDLWPIAGNWASGFLSVDYDGEPPQTGSRVTNSRLFLQRGFVTLGNLNKLPFYLTIGQMFVPFGIYTGTTTTAPLPLSLGRTEERALLVGFYKKGLYTEAYGYNGDRVSGPKRIIFQGGFNIGYENPKLTRGSAIDFGVGYITNLTDSQGIQNNGLTSGHVGVMPSDQFAGFGDTVVTPARISSDNIKHNVGGVDAHLEYSIESFAVLAELVSATRHFDPGDLLYKNHGAFPQAMHVELDYNIKVKKYPLTFGVAYGRTWQALALNLPQQSFFLTFAGSFWKNTQIAVEYRHDINYKRQSANSVGGGGAGNPAWVLPVPSSNVGGTQDIVTVLLGVYY